MDAKVWYQYLILKKTVDKVNLNR